MHFSNFQTSNFQTVKLSNFQTLKLSNFQSLKLFSNFQTFKLSNFPYIHLFKLNFSKFQTFKVWRLLIFTHSMAVASCAHENRILSGLNLHEGVGGGAVMPETMLHIISKPNSCQVSWNGFVDHSINMCIHMSETHSFRINSLKRTFWRACQLLVITSNLKLVNAKQTLEHIFQQWP